jgi:ABC-type antimicrobial peptide transport system permease subunit
MVLGTIGSLAGFFPARHASSVNPAVSLRYE